MRAMPAKLRADLEVIRCATSRRGGRHCGQWPCECLCTFALNAQGRALVGRALKEGRITPALRAELAEWTRAAAQEDLEQEIAVRRAPPRLSSAVQELLEPGNLSHRDWAEDLDKIGQSCRDEADRPASAPVMAAAIRWVRRNVVRRLRRARR